MAIESLVRKKYLLTSEQTECFASLSIEGAKYVVLKVFLICFQNTFWILITKTCLIFDLFKFLTCYIFRFQLTKKPEIAWGKLLEKFMLNALCVGITD
jgi:hypothetical protein